MNLTALLSGPLGDTVGWTLIHLLWQATAVALILGAIRTLWKGASANARYFTAIAALGSILLLPALTFSHLWNQRGVIETTNAALTEIETDTWIAAAPGATTALESPLATRTERLVSASLPWMVGAWLLGVTLLAIRLFVRTARTSRLTRNHVIEVEGSWHRVLERLRRKLDLSRPIALYESAIVEVPTVVGWLKPVILVPTSVFTGLTYRQIETILAHELAHVRRLDALVNFIQSIVETLFFYHPAVWWISGRIRIEREHCCDDIAIALCGDRVAYARALTFLEEARATVPAGAVAATGGSLLARIRRIAGVEERDGKAPSIAALVILVMLGGATAWALGAPSDEHDPDAEVIVERSGWWFLSPPEPPSPPAPPAIPAAPHVPVFDVYVPAPPEPPPAPEAPLASEESMWIVETAAALAAFDLESMMLELPDPPAPPAAPRTPRAVLAAPSIPPAPPVPRIASVAPLPDSRYVVHASSDDEPSRKISDDLSVDDLIRLRSVGVTTEYIRTLKSMGYGDLTVNDVVALRGVGVTPEYIRAMKSSLGNELTVRELIQLRGVGVTPEWIASMEKLGNRQLDVASAVRLRGVGVTPEWIGVMSKALGESLSIDDAIRLRGVGVTEDFIRDLEARGLKVLPASELVRLRGVGITAEYIDEIRKAGLGDIDVDNLVRLRGVGVNPSYIEGLAKAGISPLDLESLVRLRGVGVTPEYVDLLRKAGYSELDSETLVRLRGVGVSPEYVKGLRDAGLGSMSVSDLVRLRGVGVTPEYVREMRDAGLKDLSIEKLIRLRGAGVDASYIREMRD